MLSPNAYCKDQSLIASDLIDSRLESLEPLHHKSHNKSNNRQVWSSDSRLLENLGVVHLAHFVKDIIPELHHEMD